ncbi:MAG TPA: AMP-binding protein [Acidimicrobiia bacterium]|nr:AMP-binding protein [Acidimicrobiia bacterium]
MRLDDHGLVVRTDGPTIPGGPQHCGAVLDRARADAPEAEALVGRSGRCTYAELDAMAGRAVGALGALGVRPGDRVACTMTNDTDIVIAFLGAMRVGAIWVGINTALAPAEQDYLVRDCDARVHLGRTVPLIEWRDRCAVSEVTPVSVEIASHSPAAIAYTSGTTGFPKGAVHSHHNLLLVGAATRLVGTYDPTFRHGVCLPLTILNLMVLGPLTTFQLGGCVVTMDRTDPVGMAESIGRERIATFSAVPAIMHDLLTHPDVRADQLVSLVRPGVGGADLPEAFRTMYRERFGTEVTIGYGLTEAPTAVTMTDPQAPPIPGEAGCALPQIEIVIVDDDDVPLAPGEVGEVCVTAASIGELARVYTPMLGYWHQPDATRAALRGGILHTADLGFLDTDGHLFIKDRRGDVILRGGANVYPAEVERVLHADPRVAECAVVGYPDERLGERVAAFVRVSSPVTPEELAVHCATELARYKVPDRYELVDELPRTPMGKIRKRELAERLRGARHRPASRPG